MLTEFVSVFSRVLEQLAANSFAQCWTFWQVLAPGDSSSSSSEDGVQGKDQDQAAVVEAASARLGLLACTIAVNLNVAGVLHTGAASDQVQAASWQVSLLCSLQHPLL